MIILFFIDLIYQIICISEIQLNYKSNITYKYPKISIKKSQILSKLKKNFTLNNNEDVNLTFNSYKLITFDIKFGSGLESFTVIFDTGSIILWIPRKGCKTSEGKLFPKTFDPSTSSTIKETGESFSIEYGTGYCQGDYYNDYINFANKNVSMKFGLAQIADFDVDEATGILGVSRKNTNNDNDVLIFNQLISQKKISDSTFSLYKHPDENIFTLYFDGYHENFTKGTIEGSRGSCDLVNSNKYYKILWVCDLDIIYFGKAKKNLDEDSCIILEESIIFDTGTNFILLSSNLKNSFFKKMKLQSNNNCYLSKDELGEIIFCHDISNIPDVNFIFNKKSYLLPKEILWSKIEMDNYDFYYMNIIFQNSGMNIIGTQFFEIYHTAFNQNKKKLNFYNSNENYIISVNIFWILNKKLIYFLIALGIIIVLVIIACIINKIHSRKKSQVRVPFIP